jgi:hypothetical protein
VNPGVLFYWVTVPAGIQVFTITQTITTGNLPPPPFFGLASGSNVFDNSCNSVGPTITQAGNTTIKYDPHTVVGAPAPSPTTVHYNFTTNLVPGSTSGIDLVRN